MNIFKARHGAVTIFLVIILVPSLIVTSLFVDVSRMYMGNSVAESAADLALNSQLTNYDKDLNDIYGLFAHAKSEDDVINNLNNYFVSCMQSAGIEKDDATQNKDRLKNYVTSNKESNDQISDLLGIKVDGEPSITAVENANLSNPAELERQIVEFMKYRGPIDIAKNIVSKFKKIKGDTENISEESKITEKMNDYLEEEESVLKNLRKAYKEGMKPYMDGLGSADADKIVTDVSNVEKNYKKYYMWTFMDLYGTESLTKFDDTEKGHYLKWYIDDYKDKITIDNAKEELKEAIYSNGYKKGTAKDAIDEYNKKCDDIRERINNYEKNKYIYYDLISKPFKYTCYDNMYVLQVYKIIYNDLGKDYFKNFYKAVLNCEKNYAKAYVAYEILKKENKLSTNEENKFKSITSEYMKYTVNYNDSRYKGLNVDDFLKSDYIKNSKPVYYVNRYLIPFKQKCLDDMYENTVKKLLKERENISDDLGDISKMLNLYKDEISTGIDQLKKAKDSVDDAINSYEKGNSIDDKYEKWNKSLKNCSNDSDVKKDSQAEYEKDGKDFRKNVSSKKLKHLLERLNNIIKLWENIKEFITNVKFNNTKIIDIDSYESFEKASGIKKVKDQIVPEEKTLRENAEKNFEGKFTKPESIDVKVNDNNNPDLTHSSNGNEMVTDAKNLYGYCHNKFEAEAEEDTEKKGNYDDLKGKDDEMPDTNETSDDEKDTPDKLSTNEIGSSSSKDEGSGNIISRATSRIGNLFSAIGQYIDTPSDARDDYYVLDYIMNMFSYYTYNREGVYNIAEAKKDSGLNNPSTVSGFLKKYRDEWTNDKNTFTDNKTLTNHMINLENNYSFGNEVEYFLNGGKIEDNRSKVFADIYLIRYVCNVGVEFSNYWGYKPLILFATAINSAFPFIPAALVKTVVILALTAAESAIDLSYLKLGMKVPIIKNKEQLVIKFSGNGTLSEGKGKNSTSKTISMQYSDYLTLFLFSELCNHKKGKDGSSSPHNTILSRVSTVIGKNITVAKNPTGNEGEKNKDKIEEFKMSDAITYYELKAKVKIDPLLLRLPLMSDDMNKADSTNWFSWNFDLIRGYN